MDKLIKKLEILQSYIGKGEKTNEKISNATVLWQIHHSFLVVNGVSKVIATSDPKEYEWKFNKNKFFVYLTGKIPRGKVKAPERVKPRDGFDRESTQMLYQEMMENLLKIKNLDKNVFFTHPIFGKINKKDTIKFFNIHTYHHLKIVEEILE